MKIYFVRRNDDGAYLEWNRVVQHWVFSPTYLNGEAVEVATQIDVNFTLN